MDYFRKHDSTSSDLWLNLSALRRDQKFDEVQEVIRSFLAIHGKKAEPWMYELLSVAMEMNHRPPEQFKAALGFAADLAVQHRQPYDLTRVADSLHLHGLDTRAAELLDLAAEIDPGSPRPLIMSMNLAREMLDAKRMGEAVDRFLALGWPGQDDAWRAETHRQVEDLAKALREKGRSEEAQALLERLPEAETRDLVIRLKWTGDADLDLVVQEPLGATARVLQARTVFGGAIVANGYGKHPLEVYSAPRAFPGVYKVDIETIYNDEKSPAQEVTLEYVLHEGTPEEKVEAVPIDLGSTSPITIVLDRGRRTEVLPYQAPASPTSAVGPESAGTEKAPRPTPPSITPGQAADALRPQATSPPR